MITNKHLTNLNKFAKGKSLPILECCNIQSAYLTVTDLKISYSIAHGWQVDNPVIVPTAELVKIAKKYRIDRIHSDGRKAHIETDAGTFSLGLSDPIHWPDIPAPATAQRMIIERDKIADLGPYISTDDLRPALMGVLFDQDICATNGHILKWRDNPHFEDGYTPFIMPGDVLPLITADEYRHYYGGKYCTLQGDNETIHYERIDQAYPQYRNVIPKDNNRLSKIVKKDALKAIDAAKITANSTSKNVELHINGSIHLKAYDVDLSKEYKSPSIGTALESPDDPGDVFKIGFNWGYLERAIKDGPDECIVNMSIPNRAAIFNGDTLVMPVMLNSYD